MDRRLKIVFSSSTLQHTASGLPLAQTAGRKEHPTPRLRQLTALSLLCGLVSGCYTTTNTVALSPLKTAYPVSASPMYVDGNGDLVGIQDYRVIKRFEFERRIDAPRHEVSETELELESELNRIRALSRGDAIVNLNIVATGYDAGSHESAAQWKILGWIVAAVGGLFIIGGATTDDPDTRSRAYTAGAVIGGVAAGTFLLSAATNDPASWQLSISGEVVRRR